jgi:methylated-DNA-[protein]-cysteine S-methyltransferase
MRETAYWTSFSTPLGEALIAATDQGVCRLTLPKEKPERFFDWLKGIFDVEKKEHPIALQAIQQLDEYWAGKRSVFDVPLDLRGTAFQKQVWHELLAIPYGITTNYGTLAKKLGDPKASQAVGAANGKNPIFLIVPCHRVIGANGNLTGYAGGLDTKHFLLQHEGALLL